jgi:hypothetical protein
MKHPRIQIDDIYGIQIDDIYGRWKVIRRDGKKWKCKCECGTVKSVPGRYLNDGASKSCGCLRDELQNSMGGLSRHPLYHVWDNMIKRCYDERCPAYKNYGGRGITVCSRWRRSFRQFYNWALRSGYKRGLYLDKINNDKRYEPNNCRWVTVLESNNNKRNKLYPTYAYEQLCIITVEGSYE